MSGNKYCAYKSKATVLPVVNFNQDTANQEAKAIKDAMKGIGAKEGAIVDILTKYSSMQRSEIAKAYKNQFGADLCDDLKSELCGDLETLLVSSLYPLANYLAKVLNDAMNGLGTTDDALVDVLCSLSNFGIKTVSQVYEQMYKKSLEDDIEADTGGAFRKILVSLCQGKRDENPHVDIAKAKADAQALLDAGENKWGTDESVFNDILATRAYPQLAQIFKEYQNLTGHGLEVAIESEFSGNIEKALLAIVKCAKSKNAYFAERLFKSMKGLGTDDSSLIRIILMRCEIDLADVKKVFESEYQNTLESWIEEETSGEYKRALLALIA